MALVYIAGYVTRKVSELTESKLLDVTTFYFEKYGSYRDKLDRGGLNIPNDCACQWTFFANILFIYLFFMAFKDKICRKSLSRIFVQLSEHHEFGMSEIHSKTLANIIIFNYCTANCPRSTKEAKQKVLKLC